MSKFSDYKNNKSVFLRKLSGAAALLLMLCVIVILQTGTAFADPDDMEIEVPKIAVGVQGGAYEVTAYDMTAKVGKDHTYTVEEKISVSIPEAVQHIEFAIPSGNFRMTDVEVENALYEAKTASEASMVVISDPEKLTQGDHVYTIKYKIHEYRDRDSSKDMFYFNVMLPEWKQPVASVNINVSFPDDFPFDDMQYYAGQFGVQDAENKINFEADEASHTVKVTGALIPENYGITLKDQLPDGYWEGALDGGWSILAITLVMAGVTMILVVLWLIGGRDPRVKKQKVTKPIEGLSPVELGYIYNSEVRTRDVLYMLIQFAQKGYLKISEYEPKRYQLYKGEDPADEEKMYRNAYNILFEDVYKGRALDMDKIGPRVERIKAAIKDDVAAGFTSNESFAFTPLSRAFRVVGTILAGAAMGLSTLFSYYYNYKSPNIVEAILVAAAGAASSMLLCKAIDSRDSSSTDSRRYTELLATLINALPIAYTIYRVVANTGITLAALPMLAAMIAAQFLIVIMRARGKENAVIVSRLRRLRNFIYHPTPKEILENHLADSNYYYEMLIYALAFGGEESWAISFLTLDVPEPEWYSDDIEGHAFTNLRVKPTTIDYARDLRSFIRTFDNN